MLGAEDYRGKVVWGIESQTTEALWHALGARSVRGQALDRDLQRGLAFPFESGAEATVTANVTLYPQLDSLVIGARTYKRLDDHQRAILRQAAADTRALAIETFPSDALKAREFCAGAPGTLRGTVRASAAQVAGLEAAAAPVYTALERDPLTRSVIARIRARAPEVPAPTDPTPSCPAERMTPITGKASSALDGVYRFELTDHRSAPRRPTPNSSRSSTASIRTRCPAAGTATSRRCRTGGPTRTRTTRRRMRDLPAQRRSHDDVDADRRARDPALEPGHERRPAAEGGQFRRVGACACQPRRRRAVAADRRLAESRRSARCPRRVGWPDAACRRASRPGRRALAGPCRGRGPRPDAVVGDAQREPAVDRFDAELYARRARVFATLASASAHTK